MLYLSSSSKAAASASRANLLRSLQGHGHGLVQPQVGYLSVSTTVSTSRALSACDGRESAPGSMIAVTVSVPSRSVRPLPEMRQVVVDLGDGHFQQQPADRGVLVDGFG
jgi:hypothetical protein